MINKVTIVGHLGQNPEIRQTTSGASVAKLNVATNENYKDKDGNWQDRTEWHTVIAWRYLADRAEKVLKKGSLVYIEGKLTTRKWKDKEEKDRWTTEVVANTLRSLDRKEGGGNQPPMPGVNDDPYSSSSKDTEPVQDALQASANVAAEDDDLPF